MSDDDHAPLPAAPKAASPAPRGTIGKLAHALDERTGYVALWRWLADEPIHGGARWAYVFGSVLAAVISVQAITGWLLMSSYAPSATTAWASVHYLTYRVSWGWFIRGLHHWGSGATIVLLLAHLSQTLLFGAYKRPREMNWWFGLALFGIVLGFSLTGYLLPWDQKGYWATRVATNIMGTVPLVGGALQRLMQGGDSYGHLTLTRFYSLHVGVLPALLALLLVGHVYLFRRHGITPPHGANLKKIDRFYPKQLALDVVASVVVIGVVIALVLKEHGAPLDAPADPSSDYPARPEWYFLSLFQLLKYFHGPLEPVGTIVVPGLAALFLFALPLLDKKPGTALSARAPWIGAFAFGLAGAIALGVMSAMGDGKDEAFKKSRAEADDRAKVAIELAMNGVPPEGPLAMLENDPALHGADLWKRKCSGCHTLDGKGGGSAPDLKGWGSAEWAASVMRDPDALDRFGKSSLKGEMPSQIRPPKDKPADAPPLKEAEVPVVAAFLASHGSDKDALPGAQLFTDNCNRCHRYAGDGGYDDDLAPDLTTWGTYRWMHAQIAHPSSDVTYKDKASAVERKGHMPAFAEDPEVKDNLDVITQWVFAKATGRAASPAELASSLATPSGGAPSHPSPSKPPPGVASDTFPLTPPPASPSGSTSAAPSPSSSSSSSGGASASASAKKP